MKSTRTWRIGDTDLPAGSWVGREVKIHGRWRRVIAMRDRWSVPGAMLWLEDGGASGSEMVEAVRDVMA